MIFFAGIFDWTAQIDFILEKTKQNQLSIVGHSLGATAGFVLLSELPEYNKKVKIFHAIGPPVFLKFPINLTLQPFVASALTQYILVE